MYTIAVVSGEGLPAKVDIRPLRRAVKGGRFHQRKRMSHLRSPEWDSPLSIQQDRRRWMNGGTALESPHSSVVAVGRGCRCSDHVLFIDPANNRSS